MYTYNLYLAGSIRIWKEQFVPRYSESFNKSVGLFEPGTLHIPPDHTQIAPFVTKKCVDEIRAADAVLSYMKAYTPGNKEGVPGVDSSWECGFAHGLNKPVIALIDDVEHFLYFEDQWMLSHNKAAFVTLDPEVKRIALESSHYENPTIILVENIQGIETAVIDFLDQVKGA